MDINKYYNLKNRYQAKKNPPKYIKIILVIILIISALLLIYNKYNHSYIIQADYDEIVDGFITEAIIVRDETVTKAPLSGKVETHCKEGERISYGQNVIDIINLAESVSLYNFQAGILSYASDGLENILRPANFDKVNPEDFATFNRKFKQLVTGNRIDKGRSVFRIVDNFKLYLIIKTDAREANRYKLNELVFIKPVALDIEIIKGYVVKKVNDDSDALLIVELNRFIEEWLNMRRVKIEFIKNIYRGIVVPEEAIFTQPRGEGVLVYTKEGNYIFKEINVAHKINGRAVVNGLEIGDNIITNPEKYNYGRGG